jgi:hypothetical protein
MLQMGRRRILKKTSANPLGKGEIKMDMKRYTCPAVTVLSLIFLVSGCAWLRSYGKLRLQPRDEKKVTIQELKDNWHDYTIYYAGYYGIRQPSAVMFDPKKDDRALMGDMWTKVEDQETLSELISSIQCHKALYHPRLWKVLGPDDQLYGYLFSAWDSVPVVIRVVDDRTMWVHDVPLPPHLENIPGCGGNPPCAGP